MDAVAEVEDLEALFDQVAAQSSVSRETQPAPAASDPAGDEPSIPAAEGGDMFHRVGQLTRNLHDALRELGYDRKIEQAVQTMPDTRDRLTYIATLTGQAADRALGAVERSQAVQEALGADAAQLAAQWDKLHAGALSVEEFKRLAQDTRDHLAATPGRVEQTRAELHEIMMAQDFHDLTGQVINRVIKLAQDMEAQLLKLLVEARVAESTPAASEEWLTGPAINASERTDVVANQAQVDDLLESLGF